MNRPLKRRLFHQPSLDVPPDIPRNEREQYDAKPREEVRNPYTANLISSLLPDERHAPVLDLDVPAKMVPSKTPGHHHLYIDVPMKWWRYKVLLRVLAWAGIIEPGYAKASIKQGMSCARLNLTPNRRATQAEMEARRLRGETLPPIPGMTPLDF